MSPRVQAFAFFLLGLGLLGLGTATDAWWTIVGGVAAWATSAWIATSDDRRATGSDSAAPRP